MNKPMISLGILVAILESCSGKPVGFQGETASLTGNTTTTGDANGRTMGNRNASSDDAMASSGNPGNGIEEQIIESENIQMEAANIYEGSDITISIASDTIQTANSSNNTSANNTSADSTSPSTANTGNASTGNTSAGNTSTSTASTGNTSADNTITSTANTNTSNSNTNTSTSNTSAGNTSTSTANTNTSTSNTSADNTSTSTANTNTSTSTASTGNTNTSTTAAATAPLALSIQVPSTSLRSGSASMQATAKITGQTTAADVTWTAKADTGRSAGTIDANGLYTAPSSGGGYDITLTATLNDDPSITASVSIRIVVPEQIFVGCQQGSEFFPITADVYQLPAQTTKLPNFSSIGAKLTTVCMDQYNIAPRDWSTGFPGVTGLFEWFALRTSTHLVVASDGTHTFKLNSDDGAKLYIDGQLVIDNDGQHAPTAKAASLYLTAGDHLLSIDYFQGPRYQIALELYWKIPGSSTYVYVPKASFK